MKETVGGLRERMEQEVLGESTDVSSREIKRKERVQQYSKAVCG